MLPRPSGACFVSWLYMFFCSSYRYDACKILETLGKFSRFSGVDNYFEFMRVELSYIGLCDECLIFFFHFKLRVFINIMKI